VNAGPLEAESDGLEEGLRPGLAAQLVDELCGSCSLVFDARIGLWIGLEISGAVRGCYGNIGEAPRRLGEYPGKR
jgi:hypothetical protein